MESGPEKRKSARFKSEFPIELKQGNGLTGNCSTDGMYFLTDQPVTVGEELEFVMPLDHLALGNTVQLRCRGKVVRLEPQAGQTGVAVALGAEEFERTNH